MTQAEHPQTPRRIQRKRTKGWRMPDGAVYVGRPSLWGNPYSVRDIGAMFPEIPTADRAAVAVSKYRAELTHWGLLSDYAFVCSDARCEAEGQRARAAGAQNMGEYAAIALKGKDLACWCPLDQPCHADVLLEVTR